MWMKDTRFHHDNLAKHGVTPEEVLECLQSRRRQYRRRVRKGVYRLLAQTGAGRYLELVFADYPDEIFVFHAMDARRRDIRLLKRKGKSR